MRCVRRAQKISSDDAAPPRVVRAAMEAARAARRALRTLDLRRRTIEAAVAAARDASSRILGAERALLSGTAAFGDPLGRLADEAAGAGKRAAALAATIAGMERELAAITAAEAEARASLSAAQRRGGYLRRKAVLVPRAE